MLFIVYIIVTMVTQSCTTVDQWQAIKPVPPNVSDSQWKLMHISKCSIILILLMWSVQFAEVVISVSAAATGIFTVGKVEDSKWKHWKWTDESIRSKHWHHESEHASDWDIVAALYISCQLQCSGLFHYRSCVVGSCGHTFKQRL